MGTSNYRRLDLEYDPWRRRKRYRQRRDEVVEAYRLHGHDPRLWRVTVHTGEGGRVDHQLIRCEVCGDRQPLPSRWPVRKRLEVNQCRGSLEEMEADDKRNVRKQHLVFRAFFGVGFALLAFGIGMATANAPPDNRAVGYFGVVLFMAVSIVAWVAFYRSYRS